MRRTLPRLLPPWRDWPAPVVNGLGVGVGLAVITTLIGLAAGMPAAITAASGATTVSIADTVCTPSVKRWQMLPAVFSTLLVTALVAFTHTHPLGLFLVVLLTVFIAIFWMAWGKRGGPQTFVMVLTLVFQMAAFSQQALATHRDIGQHLMWVGLGAVCMAAWAACSIRVLAHRYRSLALAEALQALSTMMGAQARWLAQHAANPAPAARDDALLQLIREQAGVADVFQNARDLIYTPALHHQDAILQRQIQTLIHTINLRDVVQASQLDIDRLPPTAPGTPTVVQAVTTQLQALSAQLAGQAASWRRPPDLAPALPLEAPAAPLPLEAGLSPIWPSLRRRCEDMQALVQDIGTATASPALATPPASPPSPAAVRTRAAILQTLVSPSGWALAALPPTWRRESPVLRYALRCSLAVACADLISHLLPWASHPHWILMTVAVVMRGNLEQTLARRDARIQGTLIGCVIASALLTWAGHSAWLFAALVLALGLAHGFVLINYRITAASGAVLALVQGHLFATTAHPAVLDAAERIGDTLIGAALAWAFSYVLPAWERQRLPALARRLVKAQRHYAHHALRWHQPDSVMAERSLARREVYDVVWLLSQSLQSMRKEPDYARRGMPAIETLLIHSNRLVSHLAAIKGLLTVRQADLNATEIEPLLRTAEARIQARLSTRHDAVAAQAASGTPTAGPAPDASTDPVHEHSAEPAPHDAADLLAWLAWRLEQTEQAAAALAQTVQGLRPTN